MCVCVEQLSIIFKNLVSKGNPVVLSTEAQKSSKLVCAAAGRGHMLVPSCGFARGPSTQGLLLEELVAGDLGFAFLEKQKHTQILLAFEYSCGYILSQSAVISGKPQK